MLDVVSRQDRLGNWWRHILGWEQRQLPRWSTREKQRRDRILRVGKERKIWASMFQNRTPFRFLCQYISACLHSKSSNLPSAVFPISPTTSNLQCSANFNLPFTHYVKPVLIWKPPQGTSFQSWKARNGVEERDTNTDKPPNSQISYHGYQI